jgi:hypothetical protein
LGLTQNAAAQGLKLHGPNQIEEKKVASRIPHLDVTIPHTSGTNKLIRIHTADRLGAMPD